MKCNENEKYKRSDVRTDSRSDDGDDTIRGDSKWADDWVLRIAPCDHEWEYVVAASFDAPMNEKSDVFKMGGSETCLMY